MAASLQVIYNRLNGADSYHPFTADTFQDWATEAGDVVTLIRGEDEYEVPVHTTHLSWRGSPQMTMNSNGTKKRAAVEKVAQNKYSKSSYRSSNALYTNVNKKASVYFRMTNPELDPDLDVAENDLWVQSNAIDSYTDAEEFTWEELGEFAWMDYFGAKMYVRRNGAWELIDDDQLSNYNFEVTQITDQKVNLIRGDLTGLYSQFYIEKGQIRSIVNDTANGLHSEITQTAGEIRLEVADSNAELQSAIDVQAGQISLVVEGTGANAHIKPASIVAAINAQTGQSAVKISADMIVLDGDAVATSLTGKSVAASFLGCDDLQVTAEIDVDQDAEWKMSMGLTTNIGNTIVKAEVDGATNTLTLTSLDGTQIPFSKATTLTPSWSGSTLTVAATQNNGGTTTNVGSKTVGFGGSYGAHDVELGLTQNGYPTVNSSSQIKVPVKIVEQRGGGTTTDRYTQDINYSVSSILQTKSVSSNGDVTPDSGYIGLSKVTVDVPQSYSWGTQNWVNNTNNLPSGTKHQVNNLKNVIVNYRSQQGYVYFTININGTTHVFYFADNGNGWTT